ncbi:MAG: 23S rRNA (adenine(2503)-C(2))-methyltransferase RlmN [Chloroflexi bacterium]|nr:23S rRNA (adenine(2503)-C(2))-methyltransferase RlmN [Chloroflexota bacterium]
MDSQPKLPIYDLTLDQLKKTLIDWGEGNFRAAQIWEGLYRHGFTRFDQFTTLSKNLRQRMDDNFLIATLEPIDRLKSEDLQTQKTLFKLIDGNLIETILMEYRERVSLCISSQVGCALDCLFCATGQMGYKRNLSSGEIIEQVMQHARSLVDRGKPLTNIVVMGMGEPFLNYEHVLEAIDRLNDPAGMGLGERRFTISTAGIVPGIRRFAEEKRQINLAVSLHAANDELRSSLMPINKKYPLQQLFDACRYYTETTKRRITFEWALIEGKNDTEKDAKELIALTRRMIAHVNLIPLNPTAGSPMKASANKQVIQFKTFLDDAGLSCSVRLRRGIDIQAGCGQLAGKRRPLA